ncbi:MAG: hypothetical protein IGR76_07565 [Synechococcales cyanobacterium T60_A2020_003]|nr:hypothetical protein [Synechococcales cyanobacterium T60_A2020_003]
MVHSVFRPLRSRSQTVFWLSLSLTFAAIYSFLALRIAFSSDFVVQDDARQHVFWMQRFMDSTLFPNDWIADYFQSVAPWGYQWLYHGAALVGIDPLLFSKILPPILSLITAALCFGVTIQILPVPVAGFCASVLLSQALAMTDAIFSATPKAFIYPLFLAFLYYLLRRSPLPCAISLGLLGLFYPQVMLVGAGVLVLRLGMWDRGRLKIVTDGRDRQVCITGLVAAFVVLLPYVVLPNPFGPVVTAEAARRMPEFLPGGRSAFFDDANPWSFWTKGRGGLRLESILTPATNALGLLLPLCIRFPARLPLVRALTRNVVLLPQLLITSLGLFALAHLLLFKLHLPSRYTEHSLRVLLTISAGIVITVVMDALIQWAFPGSPAESNGSTDVAQRSPLKTTAAIAGTGLLSALLVFYPAFVAEFPIPRYEIGTEATLYRYLRSQPPDTLIASLDNEANNLPTFAQRPILTGDEYALPYHVGYYTEIRKRTSDLIQAQYSLEPSQVRSLIEEYGIDFWLVRSSAFNPKYLQNNPWLQQYQPAAEDAIATLDAGQLPVLQTVVPTCTLLESDRLALLETQCILNILSAD